MRWLLLGLLLASCTSLQGPERPIEECVYLEASTGDTLVFSVGDSIPVVIMNQWKNDMIIRSDTFWAVC